MNCSRAAAGADAQRRCRSSGLTFIVVAVAFKLGAVPFHMWLPDVYEGAPTSVTLFIGTAPKIAYFALALRLLAHGLPARRHEWTQMLAALAVLTLILGNVVAIVQTQHQAHAGVLGDLQRRLHPARASSPALRTATRAALVLHARVRAGRRSAPSASCCC